MADMERPRAWLVGVIVKPATGGGLWLRHFPCVEVGDTIHTKYPLPHMEGVTGITPEARVCTHCGGEVDIDRGTYPG